MSNRALKDARGYRSGFWESSREVSLAVWAEDLKLPQSERNKSGFVPEDAPWCVDPINAADDPGVKGVVCRWAVGSAKSLVGEVVIGDDAQQASGLLYYVHQTDEAMRKAMDDRVIPMLNANGGKGIEMPADRSDKRAARIKFKGLTLYATSAKKSAANSVRIRRGIFEETHLWDEGILASMMDRLIAVSGARFLILSSGSVLNDETDNYYKDGTQEEWFVCCPYCKTPQMMKNRSLEFDRNERTMTKDGEHIWSEIRKAIYYKCINERCKGDGRPGEERKWRDTETLRRKLSASGYYVQTNPNADGTIRSFHINALAVHWNDWYELLSKWIAAQAARKLGKFELFKEYVQKRLAEAWDEKRGFVASGKVPESRIGKYPKGVLPGQWKEHDATDQWEELTRFCAIDKNEGWFTVEVRAFAADGTNRLVAEHGGTKPGTEAAKRTPSVTTFEECEEIRIKYGVEANRTWLDVADEHKLCLQKCALYGWQGFWGDDKPNWPHGTSSYYHPRTLAQVNRRVYRDIPEDPVRFPYSTAQKGNANSGLGKKVLTVDYYYWSNPTVKDFWHFCHDTGGGPGWTQYREVSEAYNLQTNSEFKIDKGGKRKWDHGGRENHFTDCSQMTFVAAMMDERIDLGDNIIRELMRKQEAE